MVIRLLCCGRYVDQGGGKRKGAFAVYLEPWHSDIFEWLDLRKNHGKEEVRQFCALYHAYPKFTCPCHNYQIRCSTQTPCSIAEVSDIMGAACHQDT